jgi:DNA-binding response OmpR family regulator
MRILIAEDNPDMAFGLKQALESGGYEPELTTDGKSALERARMAPLPALIILDLMLPGMSGYRVLRALREGGSTTPVIILSSRAEEADKVQGFRLGADDYVTKPFGVLELLARVEAVLRRAAAAPTTRSATPPAPVYQFGDVKVNQATREVRRTGEPVSLTPLEFNLLLALLRRNGAVASRQDLLREVWGYEADVVSRTVDTHVLTLREKLEEDAAAPRHILTVRKLGYRLRP